MDPQSFWILVTRLADTAVILFFSGCLVLYFLYRCKVKKTFQFLFVLMGTQVVVQLLKVSTKMPRPDIGLVEAAGYAFPSGHAATAAAFYGLLGLWLSRVLKNHMYFYVGVILSVLIGYSRVALGVHTPFQVVVGLLIGWLFIFSLCEYERVRKN